MHAAEACPRIGAESLETVLAGMKVVVMYGLAAVQRELLRVAEIDEYQDIFQDLHVNRKETKKGRTEKQKVSQRKMNKKDTITTIKVTINVTMLVIHESTLWVCTLWLQFWAAGPAHVLVGHCATRLETASGC